nr:hypothetical protein [Tanacetum cinerariifolium]
MLVEVGKFTFLADFVILEMEEDSKVPLILGRPFLHTADVVIRVKQKQLNLRVGTEQMIFHMKVVKSSIPSKEPSLKKLFAKFDEFMAMTVDENSESESDIKEPPFKKTTFNADYNIKTSLKEPPVDFKLKPLPDNLEYVFLEEPYFLPVIISSQLSEEKNKLEVIVNGDSVSLVASASAEGPIPPKTAEQKLARKNELKAKSTIMLAIPDEHLLKFHPFKNAKSLWKAIKNRFAGNKESKNMHKTILKQNYENFAASSQEGLDKTYDSLPSAWNNIALIMRNKYNLDTLSMEDLYNNLKVYEPEIKGQSSSSLNSKNVAFVSSDNTSSTNEIVNTAHSVSAASSKDQASTGSYVDDVMFSFFSNQSNAPQLDNEDLEHINTNDLKEMYLKWQVAMLTMRVKRAPKNKRNRNKDAPTRNAPVDTSTTNALVFQDVIDGYDWSFQTEEELTNFDLMAYTSQGSSSSSNSNSEIILSLNLKSSALLIDEWESDSEDKNVFEPKQVKKIVKPSLEKIEFINARNTTVENENKAEKTRKFSQSPRGNPQYALQNQGIFNSGCPRHMSGNKSYLIDYQEFDVDLLHLEEMLNKMYNKKNSVLFTDTECVVLSPDFKLFDESQVLLKVPRNNNMYSFNLKIVVPVGGVTCLSAKSTLDESNLWHKRLGHINFKTMNKLVRGNLVRGLPSKLFENDHTCVAFQKGKQHKASCPKSLEDEVADDAGKKSTKILRKENGVQDPAKEDKDTNENMMFTPVSAARSNYVNLGGSIPVNIATIHNVDLPTDPLMPDLEDIVDLHDTGIFSGAYDDEVEEEMQDELLPFRLQKVWRLVDLPKCKHAIGTKWVYRNKKDERGIVVRNKARLLAQGYTQEEGIDYDEVFALIARIKAIRVRRFNAQEVLDEFYWGAHFLFKVAGMQKDDGIFISQDKYVANILKKFDFSSVKTTNTLIETNKALLKDKEAEDLDVYLYRSMIGSLMYLTASRPDIMFVVCAYAIFQVTPKISHLHAMKKIFRYLNGQPKLGLWYPRDPSFELEACLDSDYVGASLDKKSTTEAEYVDDANCYGQVVNNVNGEAHIQALVDKKKVIITEASIRRDLRFEDEGGVNCSSNEVIFEQLPLMRYEKLSQELTFYKAFFSPQWKFLIHTILQCLSAKTNAWNEFSSTMASIIICLAINQKFNFSKYVFDNMVKHLDGGVKFMMYPRFVQVFLDNQVDGIDKHNAIFVISSHTKKVFANMKWEGKNFCGKVTPLFQSMMVQASKDMGEGLEIPTDPHHIPIVTQPSSFQPQKKQKSKRKQRKVIKVPTPSSEIPNEESIPIPSNDPLPSGEDRMQLNELMILCTNLQKQVLDLEEAKTAQAKETASLKKRVKKLEQTRKSRTSGLKRLRMGRMNEEDMFGVNDLDGDEVVMDVSASEKVKQSVKAVEKKVSTADPVTTAGEVVTTSGIEVTTAATSLKISKDELTLDQTLIEIKAAKPKAITTAATTFTVAGTRPKEKGIVMQEPFETRSPKPIDSSQQPSSLKTKRLERLKEEETNIALFAEWDNTQAMMDADYELAARLQEEERGELSIKEKSRLFVELMDKRKKHFARHSAKKIRSQTPTKAQKRNQMSFVPMDIELVKDSEKSAEGSDKPVEGSEKELKRCLEIIPEDDDDVKIEATPLSSKSPTIVDYKIYKEGKKSYFKIIRADGNSQNYLTFGKMFKNLNREDLEVIWSIVKARFKKTKPIDDMDNLLFQTLKTMFEQHVKDNTWNYQQESVKVPNWKLFDSCGVYCIATKNMVYYLLVKKIYPFTRNFLHQMWNDVRLQVDYEVEMAYDLLRLIRK